MGDDYKEKILIRFSKQGALRFIGHLDLLRVFQRTIRRAELPAAYSQGFNPHLLLSFALPLPLGMESINDYAEMVLVDALSPEEIKSRLNACAPAGLIVTGVRRQADNAPGIAAVTTAADYAFSLPQTEAAEPVLRALMEETSIVIPKKTKSGVRDTDIRPDIFDCRIETGENPRMVMRLAAGSMRFLNPKLVAEMILQRMRCESATPLTRLELYRFDGCFHDLFEDCVGTTGADTP